MQKDRRVVRHVKPRGLYRMGHCEPEAHHLRRPSSVAMPPQVVVDDWELIIIAAAFIKAMDRKMYNSGQFLRVEFGREIVSARQSPEASMDIGKAMQQLKHHILMMDSN